VVVTVEVVAVLLASVWALLVPAAVVAALLVPAAVAATASVVVAAPVVAAAVVVAGTRFVFALQPLVAQHSTLPLTAVQVVAEVWPRVRVPSRHSLVIVLSANNSVIQT